MTPERCPRCKAGNLVGCYCDGCGARYADPPPSDTPSTERTWTVGLASEPIPGNKRSGKWLFNVELWGESPPDFESQLAEAQPIEQLVEALERLTNEVEAHARRIEIGALLSHAVEAARSALSSSPPTEEPG